MKTINNIRMAAVILAGLFAYQTNLSAYASSDAPTCAIEAPKQKPCCGKACTCKMVCNETLHLSGGDITFDKENLEECSKALERVYKDSERDQYFFPLATKALSCETERSLKPRKLRSLQVSQR